MSNARTTIEPQVIEGFRKVCCACVGDVLGGLSLNGIVGGTCALGPQNETVRSGP